MNKIKLGLRLFAITGIFLISNACNGGENNKIVVDHDNTDNTDKITKAICVMTPTEGSEVKGLITFTQTDGGILIEADIEGLSEGNHGFHIHEWGDISKSDGTAAGGHFNPDDADHAGPGDAVRHAGDLGNITADSDGKAHYNQVDSLISFIGKHNIIGRSVIIHVGEDDLVSQPTGDAGGRVAQGVIGVAQ
jgi:Cu-Zn family superoxide dismutase